MNIFLKTMYKFSGQPNHYAEDSPTPPPPLQVFQFTARKFLGLRFSDDAFQVEEESIVNLPLACGIYVDEWPEPEHVPLVFDTPDGGGEYDAYYCD